MQDLIGAVSFLMAVAGGLVSIGSKDVNRQTSAGSVGLVFLTAFLLIFLGKKITGETTEFIQTATCAVSFLLAVTGGVAAMLHEEKDRQIVSGAVGFVFLITSFLLLW